jgi:molybdate transport system substrate-binding protein
MRLVFAAVVAGLLMPSIAHAETVSVAVAANFTKVAEQLAPLFKTETGHDVSYSFGATGQLYTQISQGAPFQVFLAADDQRPAKAVKEDLGVEGSVFTYAVGALALYGGTTDVSDGEAVLAAGAFDKIAIADPATAPYGAAAMETLDKLGLTSQIEPKLVTGENITQTLQFIETGNAELGFVAASQVVGKTGVWIVPESYHAPIRQDAVLLTTGQDSEAAKAFVDFLQGEAAREVIESAGYNVD